MARNSGRTYFTYKQISKPAKEPNLLNVLCVEKCRKKCSEKISAEDRKTLFSTYYSLDLSGKNQLLFGCIHRKSVKHHRKNSIKKKQNTFTYNIKLPNRDDVIVVCKRALCSIFQISTKKIEIIQKKHSAGQIAPSEDKRGKHSNRANKTSDNVVNEIVEHISSFPAEISHYSRTQNPNKKYLVSTLSISQMHKLYIEECVTKDLPKNYFVKYGVYANIFSTKFNLSFGKPRSDTCGVCDAHEDNEEHRTKYRQAFEQQRIDREMAKTDDSVVYLTMDLQQVMPLPKLTTSKAFYLRQLSFYNFGIHSITSSGTKPFMMTWTENIASRGSSEVLSCLFEFLHHIEPTIAHLCAWSDSCAGQNKNFNLIAFYQYLILHGYFEVIDHKFPEVGHSYLDSDRDFGRIEKVLRKHETIYSPEEYQSHIKSALPNKAKVIDMTDKFYQIDSLVGSLGLYNNKRNVLNEPIKFRDSIRWIRIEKFGYYLYKDCLDEHVPFKRVNIHKNVTEPIDFELKRKEMNRIAVKKEKIDNLREQIKFIPPQYHWFYNQIFEASVIDNNDSDKLNKSKTMKKKLPDVKSKKMEKKSQNKWNETKN